MIENFSLSPPLRFGMINPGIYRGAYPVLPNFRFLHQLRLKTIISLTPEAPTDDLRTFSENSGINLIHLAIHRTGPLTQDLHSQLVQAIQYCGDSNNFPIYVHCLDGRRTTSLFTLLLRKVQAWSPVYAFSEYWRYQVTFKSLHPMSEIEKTTKDLEKFCGDVIEITLSDSSAPTGLYGGEKPLNIPGVKLKVPTAPSTSTTLISQPPSMSTTIVATLSST